MKKFLVLIGIMAMAQQAICQSTSLDNFNFKREKINKNGFIVLASYSVANIIYGSIAASQTTGSTKYFNRMNALFNGVTFSLAAFSYFTLKKEAGLSYEQSLKKQTTLEKLFLVNAGLDVAYVVGGFYIKERAKNSSKNPEKLKGYGESIALQGGALLLFDAVMYNIHNKHGKQLYSMAGKIQLASTENGIGLVVKL